MKQGATVETDGTRFTVWSGAAAQVDVCLFDDSGNQSDRIALEPGEYGFRSAFVAGVGAGTRYGLRTDGDYDPARGRWFDPDKLLVDPYATRLDRPFRYDPALAARRGEGGDTAPLMPKAIVEPPLAEVPRRPPRWRDGGLIYELSVRAFTMRHPEVPSKKRGTLAALAEPAVIDHLTKLKVSAVELMPITAWIDERHLPPLGLSNAWGYNPVAFMALDPRLAPSGLAELAEVTARLHDAGIGVILDVVFNHTGESDEFGPTLSLRGLDARAYFRHRWEGDHWSLVNDTGTGNTLACDHPATQRLVLDSLRHFVRCAGVDGFRFDLAPILGRTEQGFDPGAKLMRKIVEDPVLGDRVLIAEPWDIGPDGYQLGRFPAPFLEWNDRYRDDVRRFWRGDSGGLGSLATRLAGSSDVFDGKSTRSVNFLAAHDGMTLADLTAYEHKHNEANGEQNRDGHNENISWNNGQEGASDDRAVLAARRRDVRALLATLFASRGAIMLTAGDEFGRTQRGNNNAYAQDNELTWLDWEGRDRKLEDYVAALSALRHKLSAFGETSFLSGDERPDGSADVRWLRPDGTEMTLADWETSDNRCMAMVLSGTTWGEGLAVLVNGSDERVLFHMPSVVAASVVGGGQELVATERGVEVPARSVAFHATEAPTMEKRT
ncbi:MAG: glycogen debranching protein GlgX [Rhizobiaceae bacterium]|nr:glycogen debranching protein GlgX [Rhizobiaceae bacterium]